MADTKSNDDIARAIGKSKRTTERIMKLNDLILEQQTLVSEGELGSTAGEQLAHLTEDNQRALLKCTGNGNRTHNGSKSKGIPFSPKWRW